MFRLGLTILIANQKDQNHSTHGHKGKEKNKKSLFLSSFSPPPQRSSNFEFALGSKLGFFMVQILRMINAKLEDRLH